MTSSLQLCPFHRLLVLRGWVVLRLSKRSRELRFPASVRLLHQHLRGWESTGPGALWHHSRSQHSCVHSGIFRLRHLALKDCAAPGDSKHGPLSPGRTWQQLSQQLHPLQHVGIIMQRPGQNMAIVVIPIQWDSPGILVAIDSHTPVSGIAPGHSISAPT